VPSDAVLSSLKHVWRTLEPLGVPMALAGGLALAVWKHARATRDVDLLVGIREEQVGQILQSLHAVGIRPKRDPPVTSLGTLQVIQLLFEPPDAFVDLQVDLLLARTEYPLEALRRRVPIHLPGVDVAIAVLTCEDLILHKLMAGRLIDRVDVVALLRANRPTLDFAYLAQWVETLEVAEDLAGAWKEAFPREGLPGR